MRRMKPDERGWSVLEVAPEDGENAKAVFKVWIDSKKLELVQQAQWLRVYVNPDIYGPDEWGVPPSSGNKMQIFSPGAPRRPAVVEENTAIGGKTPEVAG